MSRGKQIRELGLMLFDSGNSLFLCPRGRERRRRRAPIAASGSKQACLGLGVPASPSGPRPRLPPRSHGLRFVRGLGVSQCFSASEGRRTRVCGQCFSASQGRPSVVCANCCRVCSAPAREDPRGQQQCFSHCCGKQRCFSACCGRGSRSSRQAEGAAERKPQADTEDRGAHAAGAGPRPLPEGVRRA